MGREARYTAYVVDDDPLARRRLRVLIEEAAWLEWVGDAGTAEKAIPEIDALRPALVFLEIALPGMSGLEMLSRIAHRPAVIFATGIDCCAAVAFDSGAIDYLLKPFGRARFLLAAERVHRVIEGGAQADVYAPAAETQEARSLTRLFVRQGAKVVPVSLRNIERFQACDDYVVAHVGGREYTLSLGMSALEARLDPSTFVRVHRSTIVNLEHVSEWHPCAGSRFRVVLRSGATLTASRARSRRLRDLGV